MTKPYEPIAKPANDSTPTAYKQKNAPPRLDNLPNESDARQVIESVPESGENDVLLNNEMCAALKTLYIENQTDCEREFMKLRKQSANKSEFDAIVRGIKSDAKKIQKQREDIEQEYYRTLNQSNNDNTVQFDGLAELATPLKSGRYETDGYRIFFVTETKEGAVTTTVFPHPVIPVAILYNTDEQTEKIRLAFNKHSSISREWKFVTVLRSIIADANKIKGLADYGIEINSDKARNAMDYITTLLTLNTASGAIPAHYSTSRLGWMDDKCTCFMPYDRDKIEFDGAKEFECKLNHFTPVGDRDKWLRAVQAEHKNSTAFAFALTPSFASVLLRPLQAQLFTFELWGATGCGKTVMLQVATSVWGNPAAQNALITTLNGTDVGRERLNGFFGDIFTPLDELQTLRNRENQKFMDAVVMNHSGGIGRTRGSATDTLQHTEHWNNIQFLTGEEPITKDNSIGGAKNRAIEVLIEDKLFKDPAKLITAITSNYGHAGREWIEFLKQKDFNELRSEFAELQDKIMKRIDTDQKQANSAALLLLTDKLLCKLFFKESDPLQVDDIIPFIKKSQEINTGERAFDDIIAWIAENMAHFEAAAKNYQDREHNAKAIECYGRINEKEEYIAVIATKLRDVLKENFGYDVSAVTHQWDKTGKLLRGKNDKLQNVDRISGMTLRTYRIKYRFDN